MLMVQPVSTMNGYSFAPIRTGTRTIRSSGSNLNDCRVVGFEAVPSGSEQIGGQFENDRRTYNALKGRKQERHPSPRFFTQTGPAAFANESDCVRSTSIQTAVANRARTQHRHSCSPKRLGSPGSTHFTPLRREHATRSLGSRVGIADASGLGSPAGPLLPPRFVFRG